MPFRPRRNAWPRAAAGWSGAVRAARRGLCLTAWDADATIATRGRPGGADPIKTPSDKGIMAVARQLTVGWQNRPGELANFCEALAEADVNIMALATAEAGEYGAVRLLVDDVARAREVFRDRGVAHTSIEVLVRELDNQPGTLARIARALAEAKINIEYFYASTAIGGDRVIGVFKVSDAQAADEVLSQSE